MKFHMRINRGPGLGHNYGFKLRRNIIPCIDFCRVNFLFFFQFVDRILINRQDLLYNLISIKTRSQTSHSNSTTRS